MYFWWRRNMLCVLPLFSLVHFQVSYHFIYLQSLQIYLKFEQSSGDPSRVQLLYERAITDFPVSSDLWLDYTRYLDKTLKVSPLLFYSLLCGAAICMFIILSLSGRQCCERCLFQGCKELSLGWRTLGSIFAFFGTWTCF